jgi:hypothetical protein
MKQMFYNVMNNVYVVFGCMDELDREIHEREYSYEIGRFTRENILMRCWSKHTPKFNRICSSNLDGVAVADMATIINECKQPLNNFIY